MTKTPRTTLASQTEAIRGIWCDPHAQIRRAWNRTSGRVLLTVAVTDRNLSGEDIANDDLRVFASRGLRVVHASERRVMRHSDRLFWVLAEPAL